MCNNASTISFSCQNCWKDFQFHCLFCCRKISHLITYRSSNQNSIKRDFFIKHVLFSAIFENIHNIWKWLCTVIHLSSFYSRINESTKSNLRHLTWKSTCHASIKLCDLSLRQTICFYLTVGNHLHPSRLQPPMGSNNSLDKPFVRQMLNSIFSITLSTGMNQSNIGRMTNRFKSLFNCFQN